MQSEKRQDKHGKALSTQPFHSPTEEHESAKLYMRAFSENEARILEII